METTLNILGNLEKKLASFDSTVKKRKVMTGFDGFVDKIQQAVFQKGITGTTYYSTLTEFSDRIKMASGRSGQIEIETKETKMGGNAPILSNALGKLGVRSVCVGSMGYPVRTGVFSKLNSMCRPVSVLMPGESDAIEFNDGKIIFSNLATFSQYDWSYIKNTTMYEEISTAIRESDVVALVDWANLPHAAEIWEGVLNDVVKKSGRKDFRFFFDLCDPSKKQPHEIDDVLDIISSFSFYGKVTLGMNENEARFIWSSLTGSPDQVSLHDAGRFIHYAMDIDCLLIHPRDRTLVFHKKEFKELYGRLVKNPAIQTGGGDNLNAGYILGLLAGISIEEAATLGMAASGFYVEQGHSGTLNDIHTYLKRWIAELKLAHTVHV